MYYKPDDIISILKQFLSWDMAGCGFSFSKTQFNRVTKFYWFLNLGENNIDTAIKDEIS